jgi:hypothetical protein
MVFVSSLASGLGILHAEAAAVRSHAQTSSARRWLRRGALAKFAVFFVAISLTESFVTVILNTALGLIPVMLVEYAAFRRGQRNRGWIAGGLAFSSLAALVYLLGTPSYPWFGQKDLAHIVMMATLLMIHRGVSRSVVAGGPDPSTLAQRNLPVPNGGSRP